MGMPGLEVALTELTAALFGQMQMDGQVEVLMDDIYIGADSPEELLARWKKARGHEYATFEVYFMRWE